MASAVLLSFFHSLFIQTLVNYREHWPTLELRLNQQLQSCNSQLRTAASVRELTFTAENRVGDP